MSIYAKESDMLKGASIISDLTDGARYKYKLYLNGKTYIYKLSKQHTSGEYTKEHVAELLFKRICDILQIPCVNILISDISLLSEVMWEEPISNFIELSEEFSHSFHMSNLQTFDVSTLLNKENNRYWREVLDMLFVDILCGNSDRHPGNFAYNACKGFYPLFDNGSSLCAYIKEADIKSYLKDTTRFNSLVLTKSKPVLRDNARITHYDLLQTLKKQFPEEFLDFQYRLHNLNTSDLYEGIPITEDRKELLSKFLRVRKEWFYE